MIDDEMQGDGQGERKGLTGTQPGRSEVVIYRPLRALRGGLVEDSMLEIDDSR